MTDEELKRLTDEAEESYQRIKKMEDDAKKDIVKYFDRIHDKLFTYQLFFLAGYISLVAIPSISLSPWWLLIPIFCILRLIHIDYCFMEINRAMSDITNRPTSEFNIIGEKYQKLNTSSLETILETILLTILFVVFMVNTF